jgi:glycosyltransferase involved in cell wall biosynthesis
VRYLGVDPKKIVVTHPILDKRFLVAQDAASLRRVKQRLGVTGDFILYVGIFRARKNHFGLLDAFAVLRDGGVRIQLVIAGPLGKGEKLLRDRAARLGVEKDVVFAGFVPDEDLPSLYAAAKAYVCPSLYEGFGQTLIEAMACGTPVASHRGSSLPEVCGDAALFANANDPVEFAAQLRCSIEDTNLRSVLIERGHENAARFSAEKIAQRTLQVYSEMLAKRRESSLIKGKEHAEIVN